MTTNPTTTNPTNSDPLSIDVELPRRRLDRMAYAVAGVATLIAVALMIGIASRADAKQVDQYSLEFDVAEDGTRFIFDEAPVHDDGMPDGGNAFVTEGYIYEAGAIADGAGVNADGTATHPDRVIGSWYCEGHMLGDGAYAETGPWVISKQVFDLGPQAGSKTVVSDGLELVDHEIEGFRAIVGGTGPYQTASGQQGQVLHGHNDSDGVQLSVELDFTVARQG